MTSPAKDALKLKMAGLLFMMLGFVGFSVVGEQMEGIETLLSTGAAKSRDIVVHCQCHQVKPVQARHGLQAVFRVAN
jgi:hypothetical protein